MSHLSNRRSLDRAAALLETSLSPRPSRKRRLIATLTIWRERIAARRHLAATDARSLRDAGISPAAAAYEAGKPFWQPYGTLR
jgi:uncharacterized protein YjiS (DUF1127 family)